MLGLLGFVGENFLYVFKGAQSALRGLGSAHAKRRGQVFDPLPFFAGLLPRRHRELVALIVGGGLGFGRSQRRVGVRC